VTIEELIQRLRAVGEEPDLYGPQTVSSVDRLEALLGRTFPPSYREFLERYGGGYGFIGLYDNQPESLELGCSLGDTQRLRQQFQLPAHFLPIKTSQLGGIFCLDTTSPNADGECPVILITIGPGGRLTHQVKAADSFGSYFREVLEENLKMAFEEQEEAKDNWA
jgi:hypothetical protein